MVGVFKKTVYAVWFRTKYELTSHTTKMIELFIIEIQFLSAHLCDERKLGFQIILDLMLEMAYFKGYLTWKIIFAEKHTSM